MSIRTGSDAQTPHPPSLQQPGLLAHVPMRLLRDTLPETTGVGQTLNGYMFTQVELPEDEARLHGVPQYAGPEHVKLRHKFTNRDLWDTLTPDVVDMMVHPPPAYSAFYQRQVNIAMLTSIKTLENMLNGR